LAVYVACVGEVRNTCKILVAKSQGDTSLRISRCRWKENIKMDLKEIERVGVDWIQLAYDMSAVKSGKQGNEP
jgi:hypothetical protein